MVWNILEWARRRAGTGEPARAIDELRTGDAATAAARTGLPRAWIDGIASGYELLDVGAEPLACVGTACAFAGPPLPGRPASCIGRCYEAPAGSARAPSPIPLDVLVDAPVVLRHLRGEDRSRSDYALPSGPEILDAVIASGLRGRGGAAFPTGRKWQTARDTAAPERFVVANGDEGDPGSYVDRLLLEETPHAVLAGMLACARAIGAGRGIVYVRAEYPRAAERVRSAIEQAVASGALRGFHVDVKVGAGSYVAGEETALLRSIEGLRAEPSPKPPYPAERGLHGLPTIVQNVETLSVIPWIVANRRRADTKAICLSGAVARPGVFEVALGTPLARVLAAAGGAPAGRRPKLALVGGPMGSVVPASRFDVPLAYDALPGLGHGGVVVLDDTVGARRLAEHLFEFAARESCGACTPCRVGSGQLRTRRTRDEFERLLLTLEQGSLCGFGQGVPRPLRDLLRHFPGEMFP